METGTYAVTDDDGLYHFEGVKEGTHVVQIDEETLPDGYSVMTCEENSQYAKRKISKFLDNKGGGIWRANFYLKRTGKVTKNLSEKKFDDLTEYKFFDTKWLDQHDETIEWVYPQDGRTPSAPSVNIGIKHGPNHSVSLSLNGNLVPRLNFQARDSNTKRTNALSRWRGVDVLHGKNVFIAKVKNQDGLIIKTIRREIHFIKNIARAVGAPDQSILVADGRTAPVIAIRIEDEAGRPVHAGRKLTVDVRDPYRLERSNQLEGVNELVAPLASRISASVGSNGIAYIRLEPTLKTGDATVVVTLDNGRQIDVSMYLRPEKRDWIIVGLAEGMAGFENIEANDISLEADGETLTDGRIAFFAKGMIKGDWLMTLAVDTDKRAGHKDGDLLNEINPNAYYTLYGDNTYQEQEGISRYPVYLKLEKNTFYAMFGDYNTNMIEGELTRYSCRMSGVKTEYAGKNFDLVAFAAETNQGFAKDEIAANGTSGPYTTQYFPVLAGSESIEIETRDRFRSDEILETKVLKRHLDYTIDYLTGNIIFRLPVDVTDAQFNPNVIVVDYETSTEAERNMTYGGRAAVKYGDDITLGASYIHEEGSASSANSKYDVFGVDLVVNVNDNTQVRAEYAVSSDASTDAEAQAYLAELLHTSGRLSAEAYVREQESGFGTGQQGSNTSSVRRTGARVNYKLSENIQHDSGRRRLRNINAQAYQEDNLETGATRRLSEVTLTQDGDKVSASTGLRHVHDELPNGERKDSLQAILSLRGRLPRYGLTATVTHEQVLSGQDESGAFPQRTTFGINKTITANASVNVKHEILSSDTEQSENTILGVSYSPFAGTDMIAQTDMVTSDGARRLGATLGVDQQIKLNDRWSLSTGLAQRKVLSSQGEALDVTTDDALSPLADAVDYLTGYLGLGYRSDVMTASARLEGRDGDTTDTVIATAGVARELSETFSLAAAGRAQVQTIDGTPLAPEELTDTRAEFNFGAAYRPRGEGFVVLNRFDVKYDDLADGSKTVKLVNNLALNAMLGDRTQLTGYFGLKNVEATLGDQSYKSTSGLFGGEARFDISETIDLGFHGQMITTGNTHSYAYGPSIGWAPVQNTWISLGYNLDGYTDDDFQAAEYSQQGAYLKLRLKFDQDSAHWLLSKISPR